MLPVRFILQSFSVPLYHVAFTAGLNGLALWALWSIQTSIGLVYLASLLSLTFVAPLIFVLLQKHKNQIHGPWDEAEPVVKQDLN